MSFPGLHAAISRMIENIALEDPTPKQIARKAGLIGLPGEASSNGSPVLTCAIAAGERRESEQISMTVPPGYAWDDIPAGFQNWFTWTPVQEVIEWWPDGYEFGFHTTVTDLSTCSQIKNSWVIGPGYANPDVNIRVMASLDGSPDSWEYPTAGEDWHFAGANVNGGQWLTYNEANEPYQNYPPRYEEHEGRDDAFPGGWTTSGWHNLKTEFMAETVYLRWTMDWSHDYDPDPIYSAFDFIAVGYGEIRAR